MSNGVKAKEDVVVISAGETVKSNPDLVAKIRKVHDPGEAMLLERLVGRGYSYGNAKTVLDLAGKYARGMDVTVPKHIRESDVKELGERWRSIKRGQGVFPTTAARLNEKQAREVWKMVRVQGPPGVRYSAIEEAPAESTTKKSAGGTYALTHDMRTKSTSGEFIAKRPPRRTRPYRVDFGGQSYVVRTTLPPEKLKQAKTHLQLAAIARLDPNATVQKVSRQGKKETVVASQIMPGKMNVAPGMNKDVAALAYMVYRYDTSGKKVKKLRLAE